jgi:hypothetical protein
MPVVFSPGEPETRPLRPTEIVYTTAQKVADLLGIGPSEEVLVAADSPTPIGENRKVIITGADYRNHGFEVGDTIYVYSDNDPLGFNATIDSISSLSTGVVLTFDDSYTAGKSHTDYTVALNTYVQNQASFTNGKTRGVKRSHVEQRIKEVQDRIDNVTHNAWRPYLVAAEYLNFDTYKPYRRRYFTDYVGTTPLLFRNIQQILRLEMWQGENYREIGSAETRLEIVDHEGLASDSVYFAIGNGSIATLSVGTGTTNWRADFDKVSTAQNLADLINKEDRVSKAAVEFSPTFTLEGSTSNIAVHNEVLASANADYGNGKLKLTSMRQTKGGEALQIASTDLSNMVVSDNASRSAKTANTNRDTGLQVASYTDYALASEPNTEITLHSGAANPTTVLEVGDVLYNSAGQSIGTVKLMGGSAGAYVIATTALIATEDRIPVGQNIYRTSTRVLGSTTFSVDSTSTFPSKGLLMIVNGASTRVFSYTGKTDTTFTGVAVVGGGANLTQLDTAGTELTQYYFQSDIGAFSDAGGDQARLKDWWLDSEMGIIYFNNSYPFFEFNAIKVSYIYGERYVEQAIEEAATKLVAVDLLMADDRSVLIPEGSENIPLTQKATMWKQEAEAILRRYIEVVVFE